MINNKKERFEVLLGEMRHNFKLAFEKFDLIDQRFEKIDQRFDLIDQRFERMDQKIDSVYSNLKNEINLSNHILSEQIKEVDRKLELHMAQPSHS